MNKSAFGGNTMRFSSTVLILLVATASCGTMSAQAAADPGPMVLGGMAGAPPLPPKGGMVSMHVDPMDAAPVKGAPFCATITNEHTQPFADGNRIHTTDTSTLCRDGEGRIRRESGLNLLGAAPEKSGTKLIVIMDPVAGFRYMLDSETKTAHKMALSPAASADVGVKASAGPGGAPATQERVMIYRGTGEAGPTFNVFFKNDGQSSDDTPPATEKLGDQMIEGIQATGTRITTTIPAGKMGNEQPIVVTSERWYSPELKATVMTKHNDPWAGELKTQFTNVNTSEPDRSLFVVPSDYKIVTDKGGPMMMKLPPLPPPPPDPPQ
jgi:hypothetical protein